MDIEKILNPGETDMPLVSRLLYQLIDEKYRTLLDESSDLMCIADREGKFIYVNKKLADSLGYTKKEMLAMHLLDIIALESRSSFREKTREFLKEGKIRLDNFILKTKFNGKIVGEMNSIAFFDNLGKCCGAKAVFKDHTKILEIERLEKKYESMLEDGIDSLDYIIVILDRDYKIRWASSSVGKYFGIDKAAAVGQDMRELLKNKIGPFVGGEKDFLGDLLDAYGTNRSVQGVECTLLSPGSAQGYCIEYWSHPIVHGDLEGGRIEIFRDITARKKFEETLEYYYKKVHAIMEHAVEGIVELRTDNSIEFVNNSFLNKLGYSETEMLNHNFCDFISDDQRTHLASVKLIRKAREVTFIKKDKNPLYGLISSIPLVFGTQAPHALCFISDITETRMASVKLKEANLSLRAFNDSLIDLSLRDVPTGVYNARYLAERLSEEFKRSRRYFRPFSLIMIDIDFFKSVNDTYGHNFGDVVLKGLADLLKKNIRETDVLIRRGGEEFVILLPDTEGSGVTAVAQKIQEAIAQTPLGDQRAKVILTVSMGIVSYPETGLNTLGSLLEAVDQAMYQSKAEGRNRITIFDKNIPQEAGGDSIVSKDILVTDLKERLKNIYLRNEEAIIESLRPMVRKASERQGNSDVYIEKFLKNIETLAASFSLPENQTRQLTRAAFLCNLGLLSVPRDILQKEKQLKKEELRVIRQHPWRSAEIIHDIPFLAPLEREILCHHEHFDGTGYPRGLKGDDIPLGARMILVAEAHSALTTSRPYRMAPMPFKEARAVIKKESGRQFDPAVVRHFLKISA